MNDPKNKNVSAIIQRLLSSSNREETSLNSDCDECGGERCVSLVEAHPHYHEKPKFELDVPTYVCDLCGDESYSTESYLEILRKAEEVNGRSYIRVEMKDNTILRYAIH